MHIAMYCVLLVWGCAPETIVGKVVGVSDGDTFTVLDERQQSIRVRLYGIDAPEKSQDYGKVAKTYLSDLIFGRTVALTKIETDRYGRTVAVATIDSLVINTEMLRAGLAWHYLEYDKNPLWATLELSARAQRKGLWQQNNPVAPWLFRKAKRTRRR